MQRPSDLHCQTRHVTQAMLQIRKEQMKVFETQLAGQFEDRAYGHLQKCWSGKCEASGEDAVREFIRDGINRAANYGIASRRDIIVFLDVACALGQHFDADPQFLWAQQILTNSGLSPKRKIQRLWDRTKDYLEAAKGE